MGGDSKAHRAHQMRRDPQPDVALGKRRTDAKEVPALQPGQIAMDQPWRGRGCAGAEIALLQQDHAQAASGGVARDADAVQSAADDREIVVRHAQRYWREPKSHYTSGMMANKWSRSLRIRRWQLARGSTLPALRPTSAAYWPIGSGLPMK